jgi:hypothetical protein
VTAVVHLVRHANGTAPFEAFLDSYAKHDAGHEHELVLLWKGFPSATALEPYRALAPQGAREVEVDDSGRDVQAFITAAGRLEHDRICFLNSFATIEARGWLGHLSSALDQPRAGIAGASGSWGSHRSFALLQLGLPSPYRELLSNREAFAEAFRTADPAGELGLARRLTKAAVDVPRAIRGYDSFPSPHVRTNAFLIERQLLLEVAPRGAGGRSASYRFESGQRGLTRRVLARGLRTLVVARDGQAREHTEWAEADVFWQGDQSDLLVADNQTRIYQRAKPESRLMLARYAWGDQARSGRLP